MKKFSPKGFAQIFVRTRNSIETAIRLGFSSQEAKEKGAAMEEDRRVMREVEKLESVDRLSMNYVKSGLSRLAFGRVNDAAVLAFEDELSREDIEGLDLYNVSEIKRVKGGGLEVKFFDRQKALEKLMALDGQFRGLSESEKLLSAVMERASGDISCMLDESEGDNVE